MNIIKREKIFGIDGKIRTLLYAEDGRVYYMNTNGSNVYQIKSRKPMWLSKSKFEEIREGKSV